MDQTTTATDTSVADLLARVARLAGRATAILKAQVNAVVGLRSDLDARWRAMLAAGDIEDVDDDEVTKRLTAFETRLDEVEKRAGRKSTFNPSQPRWPAGTPKAGQWMGKETTGGHISDHVSALLNAGKTDAARRLIDVAEKAKVGGWDGYHAGAKKALAEAEAKPPNIPAFLPKTKLFYHFLVADMRDAHKAGDLDKARALAAYQPPSTRAQNSRNQKLWAEYAAGMVRSIEAGKIQRQSPLQFGTGVSDFFKKNMDDAWGSIPEHIKAKLEAHGVTAHLTRMLVDVAPDLADKQPRGWDKGMTWKNVSGVYRSSEKKIIVSERYQNPTTGKDAASSRTKGTLRHEVGHAVDDAHGYVSASSDFRSAYNSDVAKMDAEGILRDDHRYKYFLQPDNAGPSETFAEVFGQIHGGGGGDHDITGRFPAVTKWMRDFLTKAQ